VAELAYAPRLRRGGRKVMEVRVLSMVHIMTKQEILDDLDHLLDNLHDQVFGTEGKIEQAEKFQNLGLDIDAICLAEHDVSELRKLI